MKNKLYVDYDELHKLFSDRFNSEDTEYIIDKLKDLPLIINLNKLSINISGGTITILDPQSFESSTTKSKLNCGYFDVDIDGLDSDRITSISIPKLDIRKNEELIINVSYYPLKRGKK